MRKATTLLFIALLAGAWTASAQELEYYFSPEGAELSDAFAPGFHNGARGLSGPYDLDGDGNVEILVTQHTAGGGRVHVIENQGVDSWENVYSTAQLDTTDDDYNARYAIGTDLDGDGLGEIVYVAGSGYAETNDDLTTGAYVWEYDGAGDDNYGDYPAAIANFYEIDPELGTNSRVYAQKLSAADVDDDGQEELLVPANAASSHDVFYVLSVSGDLETGQAGSGFVTWNIESRQNPRDNSDVWGGGSPVDMLVGDFNGDGQMDISYHAWNFFNFFNATATGTDEITLPDETTENPHLYGTEADQVSLLGGTVADIDGDGNDEAFYTNYHSGNLAVLDYGEGQSVLSITEDELVIDVVDSVGWGGIATGDVDGDGNMDVIVGGPGYSGSAFTDGQTSNFLNIAEFEGGDPTDPASWSLTRVNTSSPLDSTGFNTIHRDSLGETSTYYETGSSKQSTIGSGDDPVFPTGVVYLGDADDDGMNEVALSFQGVDDSLQVIDEVWDADSSDYIRTVREVVAAPERPFVRIYEFSASYNVAREDADGVPSGYALHANYPNPFNPSTTIRFTVPTQTDVSVRVYDATGRVIQTLISDQPYSSGTYQVTWNGRSAAGQSVASGTYFYSLEVDGHRTVRPMVLIK